MASHQLTQAEHPFPQCRRSPDGVHHWQVFVLGRICIYCRLVQARDEYDDEATADDDSSHRDDQRRGA